MNQIRMNGYERISKHAARKLYNAGLPVFYCPVKMIPGGAWGMGSVITNKESLTFEQRLNAFEYYNCTPETGLYTAYYIEEA